MKLPAPSTAENATATTTASPWRARGKWFLRLALGSIIIYALLRHPESGRVGPLLRQISPLTLLMTISVYILGQVISARRWQMLLNAARPDSVSPLPFGEALRFYFLGMFWSLWMPTGLGGDAMRSYWAGQRCGGLGIAATSVFLDRFVGLVALIFVCVGGLLFNLGQSANGLSPRHLQATHVVMVAVGCVTLSIVMLVLLLRWGRMKNLANVELSGWRQKLVSLQQILETYSHSSRRKVLWVAFGLSILVHVLQILINIVLARVVGLPVPASMFWWVSPALVLSSVLPLGIAGLGVREAAAVALLRSDGIQTGMIVAWSLLWQATVWLASLLGGLFSFRFKTPRPNET